MNTHAQRALGLILSALFLAASAQADERFDRLVVFGDSLSDTGNVFAVLGFNSAAPYQPIPTALLSLTRQRIPTARLFQIHPLTPTVRLYPMHPLTVTALSLQLLKVHTRTR